MHHLQSRTLREVQVDRLHAPLLLDIGRRWEAYEPLRAGTLVHIIGQLIRRYKMGDDEEPAVLIADFKALVSSGNMHASAGGRAGPALENARFSLCNTGVPHS
jgi:hypothetical protein